MNFVAHIGILEKRRFCGTVLVGGPGGGGGGTHPAWAYVGPLVFDEGGQMELGRSE